MSSDNNYIFGLCLFFVSLVIGRSGKYGDCHAWVTYQEKNKHFILEPLLNFTQHFPQLSTIKYKPKFSCEWNGEKISYFVHNDQSEEIPSLKLIILSIKWILFWSSFWIKNVSLCIISAPYYLLLKLISPFTNDTKNKHKPNI